MYKIIKKRFLNEAKNTIEMVVEAPLVAKKAKAGQFIILRVDEDGERIPLTIAGYNREQGSVDIRVFRIYFFNLKIEVQSVLLSFFLHFILYYVIIKISYK